MDQSKNIAGNDNNSKGVNKAVGILAALQDFKTVWKIELARVDGRIENMSPKTGKAL